MTKTALGNHKNIAYVPFHYSTKTPCEIELWDFKSSRKIGKMTLDEALDKHIKPGVILLRKRGWVKGEEPRSPEQYVLAKLSTEVTPPNISTKRGGHSKARGVNQFYLHTWADADYLKHKLEVAYHKLKTDFRVEFHVGEKRLGDKDFRSDGRLFQDLVHLRPEVIQKAMPESSAIVLAPQTDYREYCWVVEGYRKQKGGVLAEPPNVTKRFYRNREVQVHLRTKRMRDKRDVYTGRKVEANPIRKRKKSNSAVGPNSPKSPFDWKSVKLKY